MQMNVDNSQMETLMEDLPLRNELPGVPRIVTTSWDDGNPYDLEIAELLQARGLPGTFYVPLRGLHGSALLSGKDLRALTAAGFEIGGHGISHAELPECSPEGLTNEVKGCKESLEDTLGSPVSMFAYPRGRHNRKVIEALKRAGYLGARTTRMLSQDFVSDPFRIPTSVQVFPHRRLAYVRNLLRATYVGSAWRYITRPGLMGDWVNLAKAMFDSVVEKGGIWHLYGHSWEIHQQGQWDSLSAVLSYVARRDGVLYLPNNGIVTFAHRFSGPQRERASPARTYEDPARS
jgi:peptidoglycan-N-acetylglucosamine deacetylase